MGELLKWLSQHNGVLIFFLSLVALSFAFFFAAAVSAQKAGGSWSLWPPRVKGAIRCRRTVISTHRLMNEMHRPECPPK